MKIKALDGHYKIHTKYEYYSKMQMRFKKRKRKL